MPNWCNNKLAIYGPEKEVKRFREQAVGYFPWTHVKEQKESPLNFHSLVPVPPEILSAGYDSAGYDWELANWGCTWGACDAELAEEWKGNLAYLFQTAWSPPIAFLSKVAPEWPALIFLLDYEEMSMGFKGITKARGDIVEDRRLTL